MEVSTDSLVLVCCCEWHERVVRLLFGRSDRDQYTFKCISPSQSWDTYQGVLANCLYQIHVPFSRAVSTCTSTKIAMAPFPVSTCTSLISSEAVNQRWQVITDAI